MSTFYSFSANKTSISFSWPSEVTGLERIMLSAQGDLQRVLSAFFARPISIATVYSNTSIAPHPTPLLLPNPHAISATSPTTPIIQTRQVHLQCTGKTVCTATSTVRITSPRCAHLFLEEKYAIGQMFRKLEKLPLFELVSVGFGAAPGDENRDGEETKKQLWRQYKLTVPEFECEILEVFPSREMFTRGESWLIGGNVEAKEQQWNSYPTSTTTERELGVQETGFGMASYPRQISV